MRHMSCSSISLICFFEWKTKNHGIQISEKGKRRGWSSLKKGTEGCFPQFWYATTLVYNFKNVWKETASFFDFYEWKVEVEERIVQEDEEELSLMRRKRFFFAENSRFYMFAFQKTGGIWRKRERRNNNEVLKRLDPFIAIVNVLILVRVICYFVSAKIAKFTSH